MKSQRAERSLRERLEEYLRSHGKRCTAERYAILEAVEQCRQRFTADDLRRLIDQTRYHVAVPTIYATLQLLVDCGIVRRFNIDGGRAYYERLRSGVHHVHLVCTSCGKVRQVGDIELDRSLSGRRFTGFAISDYSLNIYGTCSACLRRHKKTGTP